MIGTPGVDTVPSPDLPLGVELEAFIPELRMQCPLALFVGRSQIRLFTAHRRAQGNGPALDP